MTPSFNEHVPPTASPTPELDPEVEVQVQAQAQAQVHPTTMRSQDTHMPVSSIRRKTEDSWIEVSSRPSSSSLASINEEPRRLPEERLPRASRVTLQQQSQARSASATGSSQDEYDESSSESDRVMSSSNEDIVHSEDDEDDDTRTALGPRQAEPDRFTPQPNAFSHPPLSHRSAPTSYCPQSPLNSASSEQRQNRRPHLERQRKSGSYHPDHDAALRASLTTLLSCAAAVRPKADKVPEIGIVPPPRRTSIQPTALRLVQEPTAHPVSRTGKQSKPRSRESSKERSSGKKIRTVRSLPADDRLSPSITGWIISAGVIVVFSAISFTAGYAWGKEAGIKEGQQVVLATGGCGNEVMRSSRAAGQWNGSVAAY